MSTDKLKIRRSQALYTYSSGAIGEFPELSLMMLPHDYRIGKNVEAWGGENGTFIKDPRLCSAFEVDYFVLPPITKNSRYKIESIRFPRWQYCSNHNCGRMYKICDFTKEDLGKFRNNDDVGYDKLKKAYYCPNCKQQKKKEFSLIPMRFVIVNQEGYMDDFPWDWFVHRNKENEIGQKNHLFYHPKGDSASISDIEIVSKKRNNEDKYTLVAKESLAEIFDQEKLFLNEETDYFGRVANHQFPIIWEGFKKDGQFRQETITDVPNLKDYDDLPEEGKAVYKRKYPRTLQKGAGNIYFPIVSSWISLPPGSYENEIPVEVEQRVRGVKDVITFSKTPSDDEKKIEEYNNVDWLREIIKYASKIKKLIKDEEGEDYKVEEIEEYIKKYFNPLEEQGRLARRSKNLRLQEFKCFIKPQQKDPDFWYSSIIKPGEDYKEHSSWIDSVVLLEQLKQLKIFTGFTRVLPLMNQELIFANKESAAQLDKYNKEELQRIRPAKAFYRTKSLPCSESKGEGIFIKLKEDILDKWASQPEVTKRIKTLQDNYKAYLKQFYKVEDEYLDDKITPRFVLLHTFSHLLMKEISLDSGYSLASISELIYCSDPDADEKMNGILLYTSSDSSDGSLGGLVEKGRPEYLVEMIDRCLSSSSWCSSDPLCIDTEQGQGFMGLNLSACYSCCLLPETSCCEMNKYLDRQLLIGGLDEEKANKIGFFNWIREKSL